MLSKKLTSGLIVMLLGLNFATYAIESEVSNLDSKLSGCLNLIHDYYDQNLILTENDNDLAKIKRITAGIFLSGLIVPAEVESDSYDLGLKDKIQEILKSGNPIQKEAAIHFISYMIFNYESEYGSDNVYFNLIWKIFSGPLDSEKFFNLCIETLANQPDVEISVCRAYYDLFCLYILKKECYVSADILSNIIEIGLKNEDFFVQACAQMLKFYEIEDGGKWNKENFDFFKKDILVKTQEIFFKKFVLKNSRSESYCDDLNDLREDIQNGLFDEQMKKNIEAMIKNFKNRSLFNVFINLCNTAIDSNVGIKNIIEIMGKITLESCNYDFNKDLLKVCTRLTKYPDFFDTGLKFVQDYNQMGGIFSYGDQFYDFCSRLICNNLELFCTVEKIHKYALSNVQNYKLLGSLVAGVIFYEHMMAANSDDILARYANIIRYIRKNSENNAHEVFWSRSPWNHDNNINPIKEVSFHAGEKSKKIISKDSYILGMLFSKVYVCQNAIYSFLDIACILGVLESKKCVHKDVVDFLSMIRSECPMSCWDMLEYGRHRRTDPLTEFLDSRMAMEPSLNPSFTQVDD